MYVLQLESLFLLFLFKIKPEKGQINARAGSSQSSLLVWISTDVKG